MLYNESSTIGGIIEYGVTNITGDLTIFLMIIVILLVAVCLVLRLPMIASAILVLPFLIAVASELGSFQPILGVTLAYLGFMVSKYLIFR